ncbi:MAG: fibrobacter succinogenes major paralogous domain-containing protein [Bacteroidales bacterium]|nr:fibrobacter succinogenes major paralogous domain-containing protein [Bacteroidales bacterium]
MKRTLLFLCLLLGSMLTHAQIRNSEDFAHGFCTAQGSAGNVSYAYGVPFYRQPSTPSYSVSQGPMQAQLIRTDFVFQGPQNDSLAVSPTHVQDVSSFFMSYEGEDLTFNGKTIKVFPIGHYDSTAIDAAHYNWLATYNYDSLTTLVMDVYPIYEIYKILYLDSSDIMTDYATDVLQIPAYAWHRLHGGPNTYELISTQYGGDSIVHYFVNLCGGLVKDADGNEYSSLYLGEPPLRFCWTKRNLETTTYVSGGSVPNMIYNAPGHSDEAANLATYGRLYTWYAAVNLPQGSDNDPPTNSNSDFVRGICPPGWHIPDSINLFSLNSINAFDIMADTLWLIPGYDSGEGFYSLPAGFFNGARNRFENILGSTYYWSIVRENHNKALVYAISSGCDLLSIDALLLDNGISVRCVKDEIFDSEGNEMNN